MFLDKVQNVGFYATICVWNLAGVNRGKFIVENIYNKYMSLETAETLMVVGGVKPLSDLAFRSLANIKIE